MIKFLKSFLLLSAVMGVGASAFTPTDKAELAFQNYIPNPGAELGKAKWRTYKDAGTRPVDATGGSPTLTLTTTSSNPLEGSTSFLITHSAANSQADGVSVAFTLPRKNRYSVQQIKFNVELVSGTYSNGSSSTDSDLIVDIYDVTNGVLIEPSSIKVEVPAVTGIPAAYTASFQASDSSSYRLALHNATTTATAWVLKVDNFLVSDKAKAIGPVTTEWTTYTTVLNGSSSPGTISRNTSRWRRVGDTMEIQVDYYQTTGGSTGTGTSYGLPPGYSVDTGKILTASTGQGISIGNGNAISGSTLYKCTVLYGSTTSMIPTCYDDAAVSKETTWGTAPLNYAVTSLGISFIARVPILGWSTSTVMSSDTDTRIVAMRVNKASSQSFTTAVQATLATWDTASYDSHSAFNATTGTYTAPVAGFYNISGSLAFASSATGYRYAAVLKNGAASFYSAFISGVTGDVTNVPFSGGTYLNAGDTIVVQGFQNSGGNLGTSTTAGQTQLSISRQSGPSQIAASETVAETRNSAAGQSIPNSIACAVDFPTLDHSTHGGYTSGATYNTATCVWGTSPKWSAPMAGKYAVSAMLTLTTGGGWASGEMMEILLYKNGSLYKNLCYAVQTAAHALEVSCSGSIDISLVAGDYIDIRVKQTSGGSISLSAAGSYVWYSVKRIGF